MAQTLFRGQRLSRSEIVTVGILLLACLAGALYAFDSDRFLEVAAITAAAGFFSGGRLLVRYGRTSPNDDRKAFLFVGVGLKIAAVWMIATGLIAEVVEVGAFGLLDFGFFLAYGLFLAGLVRFPAVNLGWRSQLRILLDGLVGAVSVATIVWIVAQMSLLDALGALSPIQRAIGLVYPTLDGAILIGAMVMILRRGQYRFDIRIFTLITAFAFQTWADLNFLTSSATGFLSDATPNMLLYLGSSAAIMITGLLVTRAPSPVETADRQTPVWSYAIPYVLGLSIVILHLLEVFSPSESAGVLLDLATVFVMVLVIARQTLAIHENRTKVESERRSLIASVSHELRTPLTSMIGFLTVLQETGDDLPEEERVELSEVVLEQANYMGRMVTDIILLARDTPEKMALLESAYPIQELVSSVLDTLGTKADTVEVRMDPTLEIRVDLDRVRQLASNLLTNAIRYGSDRSELRLEAKGRDLVIEVHDNGPGVPKKYQQVIWERFERGSNQLNSMVPGTGLGLAIVDMIAKAHGGTATYRDSEVLGGACFSVTLPQRVLLDVEPVATPVRRASQPASLRSP
jgi:signal transduction histidine kinase